MIVAALLLLASAGVIYLACELFVNGIEWVGRKLAVNQTAVGSVLAAFGTALPESAVTLIATAFSDHEAQREIGIGAALGGPLALSTIAYCVVGVSLVVYGRRLGRGPRPLVVVNGNRLSRDQLWFLSVYAVKIGLGVMVFAWKPWLGTLFLIVYVGYFWSELASESDAEDDELEPLTLRRHDADPALAWVLAQTGAALVVIFAASRVFVGQLEAVGPALGLSPQVTALLLSPIATELPETMNALIWVRQGKERLALANISGAMMIQATVPTAFGLYFTPWLLDRSLLVAAGVTALSIAFLATAFRGGQVSGFRLAQSGWFYLVFVLAALAIA
ncbi:cation:H+ antiporter [uncultured Gammaproteobacteria bacterium]